MARNGPMFTLLAGGVLGAGLLVASMVATADQPAADDALAAAEVEESPTADESPTPEPSESATATPDEPEPEDSPEPTQPPPAEPPEPVTYVGYVDGGGASVAVIVTGDEAIAYVCDGVSREAWLSGSAADQQLDLTGNRGSLAGSFDGSRASGEATVDDRTWTFTIEQVDPPDGLYRFADTVAGGAEVVGGWIVLPDGTQIGTVNLNGETRPAPELDVDTGEVTIEGAVVTAERQG